MAATVYKIFEQIKVLNEDLNRHLKFQKTKRKAIKNFERIMMTEEDYMMLIEEIRAYDKTLVSVSQKFSSLTREAKRVIDEAKAKSDERKSKFGVSDDLAFPHTEHKRLPDKLVKKVNEAYDKVSG